ncbi:MAG: hypothetical protein K2Q18_02550, partial [Bdellovibrionales bacterium]|nr:hypothetical protein [Bdellovibrionales bacterium]
IIYASIFFSTICFASSNSVKLAEIPRSADIDKEIAVVLSKSDQSWEKFTSPIASAKSIFNAKNRAFSIESGIEESVGDLARYKFTITKDKKKSPIGTGPISWVQVSPDEQYIFYEPLRGINTKNWQEFDLEKSLEMNGYFKLLRYSSKMKKVIIAQFDCAFDCPKTDKFTVLEVSLK